MCDLCNFTRSIGRYAFIYLWNCNDQLHCFWFARNTFIVWFGFSLFDRCAKSLFDIERTVNSCGHSPFRFDCLVSMTIEFELIFKKMLNDSKVSKLVLCVGDGSVLLRYQWNLWVRACLPFLYMILILFFIFFPSLLSSSSSSWSDQNWLCALIVEMKKKSVRNETTFAKMRVWGSIHNRDHSISFITFAKSLCQKSNDHTVKSSLINEISWNQHHVHDQQPTAQNEIERRNSIYL